MTDVHTEDAGQGGAVDKGQGAASSTSTWDLVGLAVLSFAVMCFLGNLYLASRDLSDRVAGLEADLALRPPVVVADLDLLLDRLKTGATRAELAPAYDDLQARIAELEDAGVIVLAGGSALARPVAHRVSVNPDLVPDGSEGVPGQVFEDRDGGVGGADAPELTPERAAAIFRSLLDAGILDDGAGQ